MQKILKNASKLVEKRMKDDNIRVTLADVIRLAKVQSESAVPTAIQLTWVRPTKVFPPTK